MVRKITTAGGWRKRAAADLAAQADLETCRLRSDLAARIIASPFGRPRWRQHHAQGITQSVVRRCQPGPEFAAALRQSVDALIEIEAQAFSLVDGTPVSIVEGVEERARLRAQSAFLDRAKPLLAEWTTALEDVLAAIAAAVPRKLAGRSEAFGVTVPLVDLLPRPAEVVSRLIARLLRLAGEDTLAVRPGSVVANSLKRNLLRVSAINEDTARRHPERLKTPDRASLSGVELVEGYLAGTPLRDLLLSEMPFPFPDRALREHAAVFAPSGHGKTQLLQHLICGFLDAEDPPALFIMDSQGDMLRKIERLAVFAERLADRLVILDPEDETPPALNFFQIGAGSDSFDAQINELFAYLFTAIDSDLTAKQGTAVTYLLKLMRAIPGATIETLKDVMEEPVKSLEQSRYRDTILGLDRITQDFFRNQFFDKAAMGATRQQVARRLYTILGNPKFVAMFAARENRFSARQAMEDKKIVLVNTSQRFLGPEASAVFGRFFIAQCLAAAYERGDIAEDKRHLALLVIDEASEYFDAKTERILSQARKYGLGLLFATQYLDQMPPSVKAAMNANTAIKLAGPVSYNDAMMLASEMYTTGEFIRAMRAVDRRHTEFAGHVRGVTPNAVRLTFPYGTLERRPRMDEVTSRALRERNRRRYASPPPPAPAPSPPLPTPAPIEDTSDFADRY